jgi:hypothetical protein
MSTDSDHAREARIRCAMRQHGIVLRKDRARSINLDHLGGYMLIDIDYNAIVGGSRFDWSLDDCEEWLGEGPTA